MTSSLVTVIITFEQYKTTRRSPPPLGWPRRRRRGIPRAAPPRRLQPVSHAVNNRVQPARPGGVRNPPRRTGNRSPAKANGVLQTTGRGHRQEAGRARRWGQTMPAGAVKGGTQEELNFSNPLADREGGDQGGQRSRSESRTPPCNGDTTAHGCSGSRHRHASSFTFALFVRSEDDKKGKIVLRLPPHDRRRPVQRVCGAESAAETMGPSERGRADWRSSCSRPRAASCWS